MTPEDRITMNDLPPFSALVAAWNEAEHVEAHIRSFLAVPVGDSELILCAGGADGTLEIARRFSSDRVTVIEQTLGQGKQSALRACFDLARHDIIYLTDADCLIDADSLVRVMAPVVDGEYHVSSGASRPFDDAMDVPLVQYQWARDLAGFERTGELSKGVFGRNSVITRQALIEVGAFDEDVATGTDYYLSMKLRRAGIAVKASKRSRVQAEYPVNAAQYLAMWRRWVKNLMIHDPAHERRHFTQITLIAWFFLLAPVAAFQWPLWFAPPWLAMVTIAVANRFRDLKRARSAGHHVAPLTMLGVPVYVVLDQLAVVAAGIDLLTLEGRRRW